MKREFLICVENKWYEASLEVRKLRENLPDKGAECHSQITIIDESGEDYLYPSKFFASITLPLRTRNRIVEKTA